MSTDDWLCSRDETCEALSSSKGMSVVKELSFLLWHLRFIQTVVAEFKLNIWLSYVLSCNHGQHFATASAAVWEAFLTDHSRNPDCLTCLRRILPVTGWLETLFLTGENHCKLHAKLDILTPNEDSNGTMQQCKLLPYSHILSAANYMWCWPTSCILIRLLQVCGIKVIIDVRSRHCMHDHKSRLVPSHMMSMQDHHIEHNCSVPHAMTIRFCRQRMTAAVSWCQQLATLARGHCWNLMQNRQEQTSWAVQQQHFSVVMFRTT